MRRGLAIAVMLGVVGMVAAPPARAQASAIPSAAANGDSRGETSKKLIAQMIEALGGDAWLNRKTWVLYGQTSHFYKGAPDPYVVGFEEYYRAQPFAQRSLSIAHFSTIPGLPGTNHRDIAAVWTEDNGYEVTYKGKKELPKDDVAEYQLLRHHSLETIVNDWLKQPGVDITYDGTGMVERRLADQLTITTAKNDSVVLKLDEATHLPLSVSFKSRNATYKDFDTNVVEYDGYQAFQGIMTPMTVTRYKNGELTSQRFLTKADYKISLPPEFFNPDNPAIPSAKQKK